VTLEEFDAAEPELARHLRAHVGRDSAVDFVVHDGERWRAHVTVPGGWDEAIEARCLPNCGRAAVESNHANVWVWHDHECCTGCATDPGHYFVTLHE